MLRNYYTILYHVVYFVIRLYHDNCDWFGIDESRLKELEFTLLLFGMLFINSILSINGYDKWFYALSMWVFWFILLSYKSNSLKMSALIYPLIIFFSEYYEIPFFVYRSIRTDIPYSVNYIAVAIKLMMIIWVIIELKRNGYDSNKFLSDLLIFSLFYMPLSYYIVSLQIGRMILITLKLLCLLFVMYELFRNDGVKNGYS